MPEVTRTKQIIINAVLSPNPEYVRVVDGEGKSLTFILADEIRPEEKLAFLAPQGDKVRRVTLNSAPLNFRHRPDRERAGNFLQSHD